MTEHKHTPGPWFVLQDQTAAQVKGFPVIVAQNGYTVVGVEGMYGDIEVDYCNAHLIAAAPDMLEALEEYLPILEALEEAGRFDDFAYGTGIATANKYRATIAKAKGQETK